MQVSAEQKVEKSLLINLCFAEKCCRIKFDDIFLSILFLLYCFKRLKKMEKSGKLYSCSSGGVPLICTDFRRHI